MLKDIMKEIFLVLIGGICSAIGGCVAVWYQAKKARQIRMEELRGEQQLEACKKALSLIENIQVFLVAKTPKNVLDFLNIRFQSPIITFAASIAGKNSKVSIHIPGILFETSGRKVFLTHLELSPPLITFLTHKRILTAIYQ